MTHGDEDTYEALGRYLKRLRGGRAQAAVAHRLGVSTALVCRAEKGRELSARTAERYDKVFGTGGTVCAWRERVERARTQTKQGAAPCRHGDLAALAQAGGGLVMVMPLPRVGTPGLPPPELPAGPSGGDTLCLTCGPNPVMTSTGEVVVVPLDRRLFAVGGGLLVPLGSLVPLGGMEQARHILLGSLVADRAAAPPGDRSGREWSTFAGGRP
jgi:hypothetical protein